MAFTANKRKTLETAQKYAQKGAYDKALKEYVKLAKADPQDTNIRLKIGDLYLKKGENAQAIEAYAQVAEQFSKGGFDAKAVAIYKQVLRVDAESLDARIRLGEHFQRMGLTSDALREFQEAVRLCQERELKREALELLKKVASLDPGNVPNRLHLAELFLRENMQSDARAEYDSLLDEVQRQTANDLVARVAEHALGAFPNHRRAIEMLAQARMNLGESREAIRILTEAQSRFRDDIGLLESLVVAYGLAGDPDGQQRTHREMAEIYKRRGDHDKARDIMQRFVSSESFEPDTDYTSPSIILTEETMGELSLDLGPQPRFGSDGELTDSTSPSLGRQAMREFDAPDLDRFGSRDLTSSSDLIAEAKVALEFGDPEAATRLAKQAAETDPGSAELVELLAQLEKSNTPGVDSLARVLEAAGVGLTPKRAAPRGVAPARPAPPAARAPASAQPKQPAAKPAPAAARPAPAKPAPDKVAAKPAPAPVRRAAPPQPIAKPQAKPAPIKLAQPSLADDSFEELPDIEIVLADGSDDDPTYASVDPPDELVLGLGASDSALEIDGLDVEIDVELDDAPELPALDIDVIVNETTPSNMPGSQLFGAPTDSAASEDSQTLSRTLALANALLEEGELDEAEPLFRKVLQTVPNHPQALARLGEIDVLRSGAAAPEPAAAWTLELDDEIDPPSLREIAPPTEPTSRLDDTLPPLELTLDDAPLLDDDDSLEALLQRSAEPDPRPEWDETTFTQEPADDQDAFDLAAELEAGLPQGSSSFGAGGDQLGIDEVFSAFKKGIQEQLGEGDVDAHYDLAIAYREMDLLDDALRELDIVRRSGTRAIETLGLMAQCKLQLGLFDAARADLVAALGTVQAGDPIAVSLRYDLAEVLRAAGERSEALEVYRSVAAADAGFRDVQGRITELE